ncbi:unnamed protein product [Rhizoctonia solani]|uniref:Protein kinase domain-containing protein n=1 Tax=Rhizoctonia solani TaxID=456999 RepID=A0A8H3DTW4_9AGAM|nr:unnamed protein product [Rhizoctonia solani]
MESDRFSMLQLEDVSPWTKHTLQIATADHEYLDKSNDSIVGGLKYVGPPLPRFGHSSTMEPNPAGEIFIFGGRVNVYDQFKNDTWSIKLSRDTGVWPQLGGTSANTKMVATLVKTSGDAPTPRIGHKSVLVDESLIVWGGVTSRKEGGFEVTDNSIYLLNTITYNWTKLDIEPAPSPCSDPAACIHGNTFFVFSQRLRGSQNDLWRFDVHSLEQGDPRWERIEVDSGSRSPPSRAGHAMVAHENRLFVFGGMDGNSPCNDTWCFDITTRVWSELYCTGEIPPPYVFHAITLVGDKVYLFGGRSKQDEVLGQIWIFEINEQSWHRLVYADIQPAARWRHTMATFDGKVLILGGTKDTEDESQDLVPVYALDISLIKNLERREIIDLSETRTGRSHYSAFQDSSTRDMGSAGVEGDSPGPSKRTGRASKDFNPEARDYHGEGEGPIEIRGLDESKSLEQLTPYIAIKNDVHILPQIMDSSGLKNRSAHRDENSSPGQLAAMPMIRDTITGSMSATEILQSLVAHGCHDISRKFDISHVSEYPVSSGGFGDVYCATLRNGDQVGIKCMRVLVGPTVEGKNFLKRAAHELYVWSKCRHPNILELSGVTLFRDRIAMVSPWIHNGHLRWFLSKNLPVDRCVLASILCVQIADGIGYLHAQGIVHGDLKPENVLVSQDHTPKLTDFGNAALAEYTLQFTDSSTTQGMSVRWTAPEILKQETKTTQAGDIFAFGMIVLETITGLLPYAGVSDPVVMFSIAAGKLPKRPQAHIPSGAEQADSLWEILNSCWAYKPSERPKAHEIKTMMQGITPGGLLVGPVSDASLPSL